MKNNILSKINTYVQDLSEELEYEISQLEYPGEGKNEKIKNQKDLTENLYKITAIIHQIKKLEKLCEDDLEEDPENDQKIIEEYMRKVKSD